MKKELPPPPPTETTLGRPVWVVDDAVLDKIEQAAGLGLSHADIAAFVGVASSTFYEKKKLFSEISERIERGRGKGMALVANGLFKNATMPTRDNPHGRVNAQIAFLQKQREGWGTPKESTPGPGGDAIDEIIFRRTRPSGPED